MAGGWKPILTIKLIRFGFYVLEFKTFENLTVAIETCERLDIFYAISSFNILVLKKEDFNKFTNEWDLLEIWDFYQLQLDKITTWV
jgi:hypothetical protein